MDDLHGLHVILKAHPLIGRGLAEYAGDGYYRVKIILAEGFDHTVIAHRHSLMRDEGETSDS